LLLAPGQDVREAFRVELTEECVAGQSGARGRWATQTTQEARLLARLPESNRVALAESFKGLGIDSLVDGRRRQWGRKRGADACFAECTVAARRLESLAEVADQGPRVAAVVFDEP